MQKVWIMICVLLITACSSHNTMNQSQVNQKKLLQNVENLQPEYRAVVVKDGQKLDQKIEVLVRPLDIVKHVLTDAELVRMINVVSEEYASLLIVPDAFIPLNSTVTLYETMADVQVEYSLLDQQNKRIKNAFRKTFSLKHQKF